MLKTLITALVVAGVSELGRRYSLAAAVLVSLPLTSILALAWLYHDSKDTQKVIDLSHGILWLILPSMLFFIALPLLLQAGLKFYPALLLACVLMSAGYGLFVAIRAQF